MSGYADPRTRGRVRVSELVVGVPATRRMPIDLLLALVLDKTLLAASALLVAQWVLHRAAVGVLPICALALPIAAAVHAIWLRTWTWIPSVRQALRIAPSLAPRLAVLALLLFAQLALVLLALARLPALLLVAFTQSSEVWGGDLLRSLRGRSHGGFSILFALGVSFIYTVSHGVTTARIGHAGHRSLFDDDEDDLPPSLRRLRSRPHLPSIVQEEQGASFYSPVSAVFAHLLLLVHVLLLVEKEQLVSSVALAVGGKRRAHVLATSLAAIVLLPLALVGHLAGFSTLPPLASLWPTQADVGQLPAYALLAVTYLVLDPLFHTLIEPHGTAYTRATRSWLAATAATGIIGLVAWKIKTSWVEGVVALLIYAGLNSILTLSPEYDAKRRSTMDDDGPVLALLHSSQRLWREVVRTVRQVWSQSESRSLFQFLVVNLLFMLIQLLWGVWTNSLGLISDAIHMFFDCLAIGMGLYASVRSHEAEGGGRIETLSGFANGVFLLLISVFIVFEAVQRIVEPPVMHNSTQLLVVSSAGLAVNLFGMFAMGGHAHHHHGHSHSHDHDHGHGHNHGHGHSHNMMGVYLHVMADTLGSVGVILSTLLIKQFGWTGFDPIASLLIALLIFGSVLPLLTDASRILSLTLTPEQASEVATALDNLLAQGCVTSYSSPRFYPRDGESIVGSLRVQVPDPATSQVPPERTAVEVEKLLRKSVHGLVHVAVQVDWRDKLPTSRPASSASSVTPPTSAVSRPASSVSRSPSNASRPASTVLQPASLTQAASLAPHSAPRPLSASFPLVRVPAE